MFISKFYFESLSRCDTAGNTPDVSRCCVVLCCVTLRATVYKGTSKTKGFSILDLEASSGVFVDRINKSSLEQGASVLWHQ